MTELQLHAPAPQRGGAWVGAVAGMLVLAVAAGLTVFAIRSLNPTGVADSVVPSAKIASPDDRAAFTAPGGAFSADFPRDPKREAERFREDGFTMKMVVYSAKAKQGAYAVFYLDLPRWFPMTLKDAARYAMDDDQLLRARNTTHQGRSAVRFTGKADGEKIHGLVVRAGRRLYFAMAGGRKPSPAYQDFVDSLQIHSN